MYDRILVPTDGSSHAEQATDRALELAASVDASVYGICVVETGPFGSVTLPGENESAASVLGERAREYVDRIDARGEAKDVPVTTDVIEGIPVREILEYADEIDADVIVMGTRGRGGISRMMLGSVTDGVTRHTARDVLVVGDATASSESE
ncbi:universal stress protein [Natronolimnobius baerhuensis]|uniref:Stress protein n=1 Tax=Natronolimnobius baerhuensis TaxID=253108 RepID=A0A202E4R3_9EURY|nr:universal stress protein [Natronolimnobius baerhuensis]OVE83283.1 stress protein [Natronolimnobius baerhuensis]